MESSLFALLIKGSIFSRSALLHLAENNDLFLPHYWTSSISLGNKERSHRWDERGQPVAQARQRQEEWAGVLTGDPAEEEASGVCLLACAGSRGLRWQPRVSTRH